MWRAPAHGTMRSVRIELRVDKNDPPSGVVLPEGAGPVAFAGWLELLRILSDLFGSVGPAVTLAETQGPGPLGGPPRGPAAPSS